MLPSSAAIYARVVLIFTITFNTSMLITKLENAGYTIVIALNAQLRIVRTYSRLSAISLRMKVSTF
jgi:hypothetical protein